MRFKDILLLLFLGSFIFLGCDKSRIVDENKELPEYGWYYKNRLKFDFEIKDTNRTYNLYVNLRVGNDYPFSNCFIKIHQKNPGKDPISYREEITLIGEEGNWLGKGLGDLYDFQVLVKERVRFNALGLYQIELEQHMRRDTLPYIHAAGIRVEDYQEKN